MGRRSNLCSSCMLRVKFAKFIFTSVPLANLKISYSQRIVGLGVSCARACITVRGTFEHAFAGCHIAVPNYYLGSKLNVLMPSFCHAAFEKLAVLEQGCSPEHGYARPPKRTFPPFRASKSEQRGMSDTARAAHRIRGRGGNTSQSERRLNL